MYGVNATPTEIQQAKNRWQYNAKTHIKTKTMNKALTEVLLQLLPQGVRNGYAMQLLNDPNIQFGVTLQYFYRMFDNNDPVDKEASCVAMSANWEGFSFKDLRACTKNGMLYDALPTSRSRTPI